MSDDVDVVEDYGGDVRIVREKREFEDLYHFEDPMGRLQSFENADKARLYADVYEVMGGFREEKTGERGVPPAVARAREDVLMAYLTAQPTMSLTWVARHFDLPEDRVREYVSSLRDRAKQQRADDS